MKKNAFWNVFFNYFPTIISFLTGFLFIPIYLKKINFEIYSLWLASTNIITLISIVDPGLNLIIQQKIAILNGTDNKKKICDFIVSAIIITFSTSVLIFLFGYLYYLLLLNKSLIFSESENHVFKYSFLFSLLGTSFSFISYTLTSISQGFFTSFKIGLIYSVSVVTSSIVLLILLYNNFGLFSIAFSQFLTGFLLLFGNSFLLYSISKKNRLVLKLNKNNLYYSFKMSSRTLVAKSSKILISNLDVFLINNFVSSTAVLPLIISKKIPDIIKSLIERPFISLMPTVGYIYGKGDNIFFKNFISNLIFLIIWLIGFYTFSVFLLNRDFISFWVGSNFYIGNISYSLIAICVLLQLISNLLVNYYFSIGFNIRHTNNLSLIELTCYIAFYLFLFFIGSSQAIFIAPILSSLISIFILIKKNNLYIDFFKHIHLYKKELISIFFLILLIIFTQFFFKPANLFHIVIKYILSIFFYITLLFTISKKFRNFTKKILNIFYN